MPSEECRWNNQIESTIFFVYQCSDRRKTIQYVVLVVRHILSVTVFLILQEIILASENKVTVELQFLYNLVIVLGTKNSIPTTK